ncbi:MAG TPA: hypothetical protein VF122_05970 [Caulobacteraceae bacterium]
MLALAACDQSAPQAKSEPAPQPTVQPTPQPPDFYVGRWAVETDDCGDRAWTFTASSLAAPDGACRFDAVKSVPEGVEIAATCDWLGETRKPQMRLSYAQSAKALLVMEGPSGDMGLVACLPEDQPG